ncbi:membrane-bound serine protease (ClpP class) [Rhizobiales bacterium GAS191]|nr:membrane-bound serine protease (ClpP class) [Rhizobiales bacterium GAS191]
MTVKSAHLGLLMVLLAIGANVLPLPVLPVSVLPAAAQRPKGELALMVEIEGPIGPATVSYVQDALAVAAKRNAEVVILRLNTPGGLVTSMREIIADVLKSPVPVIGYVAPSGAHAASAGTYILYATHVAAMAPGTNLGAATPVDLGGPLPGLPSEPGRDKDSGDGKDKKNGAQSPAPQDTMAAKATNDAAAFIRSLAELRGRNADWAEEAVRKAASLSANAALQTHVIDLVARDPADLLDRIDGRTVDIAGGTRALMTKGLTVEVIRPSWFMRLLAIITDPNVALILVLVGVYGLIFEFWTPGAVAPGTIGGICLLLGLYALNLLPIDYAGLALMLLGIALLIAETFNPTVVVGLGGVVAFLLGAAMLFKAEAPGFRLSFTVLGLIAAMTFGLALLTGRYLWAARARPPRVGAQAMQGMRAVIIDWSGDAGHVLAQGERWQANGGQGFMPGEIVEVTSMRGLTLMVRQRPAELASDGGIR